MTRQLAQLSRLLGLRARIGLGATAVLLIFERLVLAAGVLGLAGRLEVTWAASAGVAVLWALRGVVRQSVTREARERLTMIIATAALERGADGSFLPGEDADAAVFEGRNAAEQVIVRHAPPLVAEPIAALILLYLVKPPPVPVLTGLAAVSIAALLLVALRRMTVVRQRGAWRKYIEVARDTLTSIRAAPELIASGHEGAYLERLRAAVRDWTDAADRAERNAALFQRIPFAATAVVGAVLIIQEQSLELEKLIRLGVFFPPLAGLMRTAFEIVRTAPRIQSLGATLHAHEHPESRAPRKSPPELPCEIRFEGVGFAYDGVPVLKDVSFVWKAGEVLGIKGPNGSGKSTLLKLILGLLVPTEGRILVGGVDLREIDLPAWRRGIAYLPQRPYVPDKATVIEAMRLTAPGLTDEEARSALARIDAGNGSNRALSAADPLQVPMTSLSVGARQRVHLARVFAGRHPFTLLDEPDENLDAAATVAFLGFVGGAVPRRSLAIISHQDAVLAPAKEMVRLE